MLDNTRAYLRLKEQVQASFDFAVVVCHGIPALKRQISFLEKGVVSSLPNSDYFPPNQTSPQQLKAQASDYKRQLASFLLLSSFSFFEAFVIDAIEEMIDFHGGVDSFINRAESREKKLIAPTLSQEAERAKRILSAPSNPHHIQKYKKHSKKLAVEGYRFPSERFSTYGVRMLVQKLANLRPNDIPDLLRFGLHMNLDDKAVERFHSIRDTRNKLAHGENVNLSLRDVSEMNDFLRKFSNLINQHLVQHFFVSERYL